MKFLKTVFTAVLTLALVACSNAPSDADVQAVTQQSLQQVDQQLAPLGLRWSDVFDTQVKIKNKAKQGMAVGSLKQRPPSQQKRISKSFLSLRRCWFLRLRVI